jgi:hypothetical protein
MSHVCRIGCNKSTADCPLLQWLLGLLPCADLTAPDCCCTPCAGENNFLLRGNKFDVLRNVAGGGVEDKGISFTLTPPAGSAVPVGTRRTRGTAAAAAVSTPGVPFTPSRVLLTHGEERMNLLTPENPSTLHHADITTGQIVSTFKFQKDSVDVPIVEITSDYKAAQMEHHSQFLGLDHNRICRCAHKDLR